jgi:hypothetical protein
MPSSQYNLMRKQLSELRRSLLPRDIKKDILDFTPRMSVRALSYRILSHAEFETYLETRALEIVMATDNAWKTRGHISRSTLCLIAFSGRRFDQLPDTLKAPAKKKETDWSAMITPDKRISACMSEFTYYLRRHNHGIKEENLISILLRVGLAPDALDEILVAEMTDLGVKRGEVAHGGAAGYVTKGVNPRDEYERVKRIVEGLKPVDEALTNLLHAAK